MPDNHSMTRNRLIYKIRERTFCWWEGSGALHSEGTCAFLSLAGRRVFDYNFNPDYWDPAWFEEAKEFADIADILLE